MLSQWIRGNNTVDPSYLTLGNSLRRVLDQGCSLGIFAKEFKCLLHDPAQQCLYLTGFTFTVLSLGGGE